ncbi:MAG: type II secretion system F family protein [Alphaproteobacteria bacterium]
MWILARGITKKFSYKGLDQKGQVLQGTLPALTKEEVLNFLSQKGIDLIWCRRQFFALSLLRPKPTEKDFEPLCLYLFYLLKGGVSLKTALEDYLKICPKKIKPALEQALLQLTQGQKVSQVFANLMPFQGPYVQGMLELAESTGKLAESFHKIAQYFKWVQALKNKFKSVLRYPLFLFVMVGGILVSLFYFLLPQLQDFFLQTHQNLPLSTRLLIGTLHGFQSYGLLIITIMGGMIFVTWWAYTQTRYRLTLDQILYKIPLLGTLLKAKDLSFQSEILSSLFSAKIDILRALEILEKQSTNRFLKQRTHFIQQSLRQGKTLGESFAQTALYPPFMIHLIQVGESTDSLDETFGHLRGYFNDHVNDTLSFLTDILQPLLLLFLGVILLWFVFALFYPFYESLSGVGL